MSDTIYFRILDWPTSYLTFRHNGTLLTLLTSALIFYGGYRDFVARRFTAAKTWCAWAMLILVFYSSSLFYYDQWLALILVLAALAIELALFAKVYFESEEKN